MDPTDVGQSDLLCLFRDALIRCEAILFHVIKTRVHVIPIVGHFLPFLDVILPCKVQGQSSCNKICALFVLLQTQ